MPAVSHQHDPGKQNSEFVLQFLENEKIAIASLALGRRHPRKIFFHTHNGDVYVKRINPSGFKAIAATQNTMNGCEKKRMNPVR